MRLRLRYVYVGFLVAYLVILGLPSVLPVVSEAEKASNVVENNARIASVSVSGIFGNNLLICVLSALPFFGVGFLGAVIWQTGVIGASYASVGLAVYFNPFVWVEVPVYAFMALTSCLIYLRLFKRDWRGAWGLFLRGVGVSVVVMLISAFVEFLLVKGVSL